MIAQPTKPLGGSELDPSDVEQLLEHFERLEAQFEKVREGLMHAHRLTTLGTITSAIAHEYNNILTPVISYAQIALSNQDDQAMLVKALQKALAGAERAAGISSSLLASTAGHSPSGGGAAWLVIGQSDASSSPASRSPRSADPRPGGPWLAPILTRAITDPGC